MRTTYSSEKNDNDMALLSEPQVFKTLIRLVIVAVVALLIFEISQA